MTLSDKERREAMNVALVRMLEDLRGGRFREMRFEVRSSRFADLPTTTWAELESSSLVERRHLFGSPGYVLTGGGWIHALKATEAWDSGALKEDAIRLRTALKDLVKGRPLGGVVVSLVEIQAATGLSANWLANAFGSRLLQLLWIDQHLDIEIKLGQRIRIPERFGSNRISGFSAGPFPDP